MLDFPGHVKMTGKTYWTILFIIATTGFSYHSYTVICRYVKVEILQIRKFVYNETLPMPIVRLLVESRRNISSRHPFLEVQSFQATFKHNLIPEWALYNETFRTATKLQQYIFFNAVKDSFFEEAKTFSWSSWPLRTDYVTGGRDNGLALYFYINSSNYRIPLKISPVYQISLIHEKFNESQIN